MSADPGYFATLRSAASRPVHLILGLTILLLTSGTRAADSPLSPEEREVTVGALKLVHDHCISCHGEKKAKSGLKLSSRADLLKGGDEGKVIIPGNAAESRLIQYLLPDAEIHMPPKGQFNPDEIDLMKAWVNLGAPWAELEIHPNDAFSQPASLGNLPESYHPGFAISISPDESKLAASRGAEVLIYDLKTTTPQVQNNLASHTDVVHSLTWSKDGKLLASAGYQKIILWNTETMAPATVIDSGIDDRVTATAFSSDGVRLFFSDGYVTQPARISVAEVSSGSILKSWEAHQDVITALTIDHENGRLFSSSVDRMVKCWNTDSYEFISKFEGHTDHVLALALNTKGELLATAGSDNQVKVWDIATGEQKITVMGHPAAITGLCWTKDTNQIASACEDGIVRLSTEAKNRPQKAFKGAPDVVYSVTATADGKKYFGGCHDGIIYTWDPDGKKTALPGPE